MLSEINHFAYFVYFVAYWFDEEEWDFCRVVFLPGWVGLVGVGCSLTVGVCSITWILLISLMYRCLQSLHGMSYTKRFSLGGIQLFLYKRLSQYVTRLESSTNFQGVTDLLCLLTDVTYMEEIEHLLPIIFNYCPVCVILFLIQGLHHCGACETTGHNTCSRCSNSCFFLLLWQIQSALSLGHLITPIRILGWW